MDRLDGELLAGAGGSGSRRGKHGSRDRICPHVSPELTQRECVLMLLSMGCVTAHRHASAQRHVHAGGHGAVFSLAGGPAAATLNMQPPLVVEEQGRSSSFSFSGSMCYSAATCYTCSSGIRRCCAPRSTGFPYLHVRGDNLTLNAGTVHVCSIICKLRCCQLLCEAAVTDRVCMAAWGSL